MKISSKEPTKSKTYNESWKFNNMKSRNSSKKFKKKCSKQTSLRTKDSNSSTKGSWWKKKFKDKKGKCTKRYKNLNKVKSIPINYSKASPCKMVHASKSLPWTNLKKSRFNRALSTNPSNNPLKRSSLQSMSTNQSIVTKRKPY